MEIFPSVASTVVIVSSCWARSWASPSCWDLSALVRLDFSESSSGPLSVAIFSSSGSASGRVPRDGAYAAPLANRLSYLSGRACSSLVRARVHGGGGTRGGSPVGLGLTGLRDLSLLVLDEVPGVYALVSYWISSRRGKLLSNHIVELFLSSKSTFPSHSCPTDFRSRCH